MMPLEHTTSGTTPRTVHGLNEAAFAAVVERLMHDEGWVCDPTGHDDVPAPGECIDCDATRHRFGYRLHAALVSGRPIDDGVDQ